MSRSIPGLMRTALMLACAVLLVACKPAPPAERLAEAQQLLQERQTALAIIKLEQLVTDAPEDPATLEARMILGMYFMENLKQYRRAEPFLRFVYEKEGIKTERGFAAFMSLVRIPYMQQEFDAAFKTLDEGIARVDTAAEPEVQGELAFTKAMLQVQTRDEALTSAGLEGWRKLMLESKSPETRGRSRESLAAFHRTAGRFAESTAVYDEYLAMYPDDPTSPHLILAKAINLWLDDKNEESASLFAQGEKLMEGNIARELNKLKRGEQLVNLARYNESIERYDRAEELMLRAMGENTGTRLAIETQFAIGDMWGRAGEIDKAIAVFERIDRENPNTNIAATARQRLDTATELKRQMDAVKPADGATTGTAEKAPAP